MPVGTFLGRLRNTLASTREGLEETLRRVSGSSVLGEEEAEALEEALLRADVGVATTARLVKAVERSAGAEPGWARTALRREIARILGEVSTPTPNPTASPPWVVLVVGVNGTGKTTTVAKLAAMNVRRGRSALVVAADTFRAAASQQLALWAERSGAGIVESVTGADPASVAFDGVAAGRARGADVVIVDTAGRLHAKRALMDEVAKIHRVIGKAHEGAPHETLLVLDATTGQNAIRQAEAFARMFPLTGLVLTKLDGTARGGVVVGIADVLSIPVRYVGVGEGLEDLLAFDPDGFAEALTADR